MEIPGSISPSNQPRTNILVECSVCHERKEFSSNGMEVSLERFLVGIYCPKCRTRTTFNLIGERK
jgi:hypothetical protein